MRHYFRLLFVFAAFPIQAQTALEKPADPYYAAFHPLKAPEPAGLLLREGDRVAICGDSITEQKMYSRIMETYLTVAVPELKITVRQYGWSGETAPGFLARMTNDALQFHPALATTCYGMNDHGYRPYEAGIGDRYRASSTAIVEAFKTAGARVIQGSPGCIGRMPPWSQFQQAGPDALNNNLCELRNIDIGIADKEQVAFADVFWPMLTAAHAAREKYSPDYALAGKDGVHPGWSGHLVMAYAFLKAMGLDGNIGVFTVDLGANRAEASAGHEIVSFSDGSLTIKSSQYPFCAAGKNLADDNTIRSGMSLVPFNQELNRLTLVAKNGKAGAYKVTWGTQSKTYTTDELTRGINLAADFDVNPFSEAFDRVDAAVAAKQGYETRQIKELFHGPEGRRDLPATAALTEETRAPLAEAIQKAFVPVTHTLKIEAQ
jgi:lysophospholipase L1-like esterase